MAAASLPLSDPREREKASAAQAAARLVAPGAVVGLGSGSTARYAVRALAERIDSGLKIVGGVPTSRATGQLAASLGIPLLTGVCPSRIDIALDGADEFDAGLHLIKGGGGALLREKIVASVADELVIVCDASKRVSVLGRAPLPVEVVPFGWQAVARRLVSLGATAELRARPAEDGTPQHFITEDGHYILDCRFQSIPDPSWLAHILDGVPGVVEHGLFIGMATRILVARGEQVEELTRPGKRSARH